jgi:hypothetical protein
MQVNINSRTLSRLVSHGNCGEPQAFIIMNRETNKHIAENAKVNDLKTGSKCMNAL